MRSSSTCGRGAGVVGVNREVLHQASHEGDAAAASVSAIVRGTFQAPVSTTVRWSRSTNAVARRETVPFGPVAVAVLDCVGDGFAGGDENVLNLIGLDPRLGQPAAQGGTARSSWSASAGNLISSGAGWRYSSMATSS